jgi:hypothetical protein
MFLLLCLSLAGFAGIAFVRGRQFLQEAPSNALEDADKIVQLVLSSLVLSLVLTLAVCGPFLLEGASSLFVHHHTTGPIWHETLQREGQPVFVSLTLLLVALFLWRWSPLLLRWFRLKQQLDSWFLLTKASEKNNRNFRWEEFYKGPVLVVPGAWAGLLGIRKPVLLLGEDLVSQLSDKELQVLLLHEEAHRRRRDSLFKVFLTSCSVLVPTLGKKLLTRWLCRIEEICDAFAAHRINDPLLVASTLVKVQRLQITAKQHYLLTGQEVGVQFMDQTHLESRVHALLAMETTTSSSVAVSRRSPLLTMKTLLFIIPALMIHPLLDIIVCFFNLNG